MLTKEDLKGIENCLDNIDTTLKNFDTRISNLEKGQARIEVRLSDIDSQLKKLDYSIRVIRKDMLGLYSFTINVANHIDPSSGIYDSGWVMQDRPRMKRY